MGDRQSVLGRGVGALLGDPLLDDEQEKFFYCEIDRIKTNPHQPRTWFEPAALEELAQSIRQRGVIQPLLVTRAAGGRFELVAGERRLRASRMAGLGEVPVVVMDDEEDGARLELALIENIQRQDLNPIEEARAYARLIEEFGLTQEQAAAKVGKKRSTITNALRLLRLPDYVQDDLVEGRLSEGHARVLLRISDDPERLRMVRDQVVNQGLSVRKTENLLRNSRKAGGRPQSRPKAQARDEDGLSESFCKAQAVRLGNFLGAGVRIQASGTRGRIEIDFYSADDLDRLLGLLLREG